MNARRTTTTIPTQNAHKTTHKTTHKTARNLTLISSLLIALNGCSSSGSSGGGNQPDPGPQPGPDEPTQPLPLTSQNAMDFGVAFQRSLYNLTAAIQPYADGQQPHELIKAMIYYPDVAKTLYTDLIQPDADCENGKRETEIKDTNLDGLITGLHEEITYRFTHCQINNRTYNGTLRYGYDTASDTDYTVTVQYQTLTLQTGTQHHQLNGGKTLQLHNQPGLVELTSEVSENGLSAQVSDNNQLQQKNQQQAGYQQHYQRDGNQWQLNLSGDNTLTLRTTQDGQSQLQSAKLTTEQTNPFNGLTDLATNTDTSPSQGQYHILWNSEAPDLADQKLQYTAVPSTIFTEDYKIRIDFYQQASDDTATDTTTVSWEPLMP